MIYSDNTALGGDYLGVTMRLMIYISVLCVISCALVNGERPIGVSPQLAPLYEERQEFECLDGSKKIPFDQVNDEYCDCPDGSDEPGTSACSNGKFYCQNAGFRPQTIPSSHVNDFICDCCDGSDEWSSGVQCPNICAAQGEQARADAKRQRQIQEAGWAKRVELAKNGASLLQEKRAEIEKSRKEVDELQHLKTAVETKKNAAEKREQEAKQKHEDAFNVLKEEHRTKKDNELFAQLAGNDFSLKLAQFEEYVKSKGVATAEEIQEIFNGVDQLDAEVFRTVSTKVRQLLRKLVARATSNEEGNATSTTTTGQAEVLPEGDHEDTEIAAEPPHNEGDDGDRSVETSDRDDHVDAEEELASPPYDEVTQSVINEAEAARREFDDMTQKIADLENVIRSGESTIEFEFGADSAWAPLKGQCAELSTSQYVYRYCPFDRTVQKDRNGNLEVNLGYWGRWSGPDTAKFSAQLYEKGQGCWNGPERSTRVQIECGAMLELIDASEPSKCEYHFTVKSPAVCENPADTATGHDEF